MPRWVLVDDNDPDIHYSGSWFKDQSSQNNLGNFGQPYLNTLHGTNDGGSFSYSFRGSKVLITGTVQYPTLSNGTTNPSWECSVDGVAVDSITYTNAQNRMRLCERDGLSDGLHTITVKTKISFQHTFWLDYVQYLPFEDVSLSNAAIFVEMPDPGILVGPGWTSYYPGLTTSNANTTFSFNFVGISLIWMGFYDIKQSSMDPTTATYSIDGQPHITFQLSGKLANSTNIQYNQLFFQTDQLTPGNHKLDVVYQGDTTKTPLNLYVLIIQNGTTGTSTISGVPPVDQPLPSSSNDANHDISPQRQVSTGVIAGAVIGGLLCICIVVLGFFWCLRRRRPARTSTPDLAPSLDPFVLSPSVTGGVAPHLSVMSGYHVSEIGRPPTILLRPEKYFSNSTTTVQPIRANDIWSNGSPGNITAKSLVTNSTPSTLPSNSSSSHYTRGPSTSRDEDSGLRHVQVEHILPVVTLPPLYTPT